MVLSSDGDRKISREVADVKLSRKDAIENDFTRTKTDTGWQEENSKTRGRTIVKELGKIAP